VSTFEERLRARINTLITETMDDAASEARKAVTPPASFADRCECHGLTLTARLMAGTRCLPKREETTVQALTLPGTQIENNVYLRFDDAAFEQWFRKWFDKQVRIHGGMRAMLGRVR
jgi:hypothetical protein